MSAPTVPVRSTTDGRPSFSSEAQQAAAGTTALGAVQLLGRGLALAFVVVATRIVSPSEWGRYATIAGLVTFAGFVADFGSTTVITRVVSRDPRASNDLLSQTMVASIAVGFVGYAVVIGYVAVAPYPRSLLLGALVGGLAIPADAGLTSISAALDGHGLIARRAVISFLRVAVVAVVGLVGVVVTGNMVLAMIGLAAGPIVGLSAASVVAHRHRVWRLGFDTDLGRSFALFRAALPYALLGGIGAVVGRLDLIVLSWMSSAASTGRYDLALRAIEAVTALGTIVGAPALFILARRLGSGDRDGAARAYRHAVRVAYLIGLPLSSLLVGLHRPLTRLIFGERYLGVAPLIALLGLAAWLTVLGWAQGAVVLAGDTPFRALRASMLVLASALLLDLALIPSFDATGAAIATGLTAVVACAVFDMLNRPVVGIATPRPPWRLMVACVGATVAMLVASSVGHGWWGFVAALVLPAMLVGTRVVSTSDLKRLRQLVGSAA